MYVSQEEQSLFISDDLVVLPHQNLCDVEKTSLSAFVACLLRKVQSVNQRDFQTVLYFSIASLLAGNNISQLFQQKLKSSDEANEVSITRVMHHRLDEMKHRVKI